MKRVFIIGTLVFCAMVISSCTKENIEPKGSTVHQSRTVNANCNNNGGSTVVGDKVVDGDNITDPNNDDYTRKPTKTKK